jgi:predicted nucleic acid-binding protein
MRNDKNENKILRSAVTSKSEILVTSDLGIEWNVVRFLSGID